ncbi:MCE family protein [bacterium]|nr:MCE family protein [bacterium]
MNYTRNEIKAGVMVLLSIGILVVFILLISGLSTDTAVKEYRVMLRHTGGIVKGSLVRYGGMQAGKVIHVAINPEDPALIEFHLEIDSKIPVKTDSRAFLNSVGLLDDYYIEIQPGSGTAPDLAANGIIPSHEAVQFTQLAQPVQDLSAQMEVVLGRVNDIFNDQSRQHVASIVGQLDSLVMLNNQNLQLITANLVETSNSFAHIGRHFEDQLISDDMRLDSTWQNIEQTAQNLNEMTTQLRQTAETLNVMMATNDQQVNASIENIYQISENLRSFSAQVKARPWSLVRKNEPALRKLPEHK